MTAFGKSVAAVLAFTLSTFALAQAPIVRQPPSTPPPNQQPQYSVPPADQQNQPPIPPDYAQAAQQPGGPAPAPLPEDQLDQLVNRIALYPDPLLAQTLTAATYWDEIADAAKWADEHAFLHGDSLYAAPDDFAHRRPVCAAVTAKPSTACQTFLHANEKAAAQYELERRLAAFELSVR